MFESQRTVVEGVLEGIVSIFHLVQGAEVRCDAEACRLRIREFEYLEKRVCGWCGVVMLRTSSKRIFSWFVCNQYSV